MAPAWWGGAQMVHEITILTLTSPAPVHSSGGLNLRHTPFAASSRSQPLDLSHVEIQTMYVSDDDDGDGNPDNDYLDGIYARKSATGSTDSDQVLSEPLTLQLGQTGQTQTYEAGTQIGYDFSGIMLQVEDGVVIAAYEVAFPRTVGTGALGDIMGGKYSVMIIPIPYTDADGNLLEAQAFDPTKTYYFKDTKDYNTSDYTIDYFQADCFATGTLIDTPDGPRPVELLKAGDRVITRDHGAQVLLWAGHMQLDGARLDLQPNLRPIRISAGSLAPGYPSRDLVLSPQHRVLVRSNIVQRMFGLREILVAAKHLTGLPGIEVMHPPNGVGYHHLLLDRHQILRSEGAWTESLYLGPQAMKGLPPGARREITALFPELEEADFRPQSSRRMLTGKEGRNLAMRHGKNRKDLFDLCTTLGRESLLSV